MNHAFDRPVAGIGIDGRAGEHQRVHLVGESRRHHGCDPAALAKADQIHATTKIVDRNDHLGKVVVDLKILHVIGRRLPVGQGNVANAIGQQRLYQALAFMIVGDHGGVTGMGRIDERGNAARLAVFAQSHGPQIETHLVRRRKLGTQVVVNLDLFIEEFEVLRVKLGPFLDHLGCHRHRPERRHAHERGIGGFDGWLFWHDCSLCSRIGLSIS